jgi:hypothetical protein
VSEKQFGSPNQKYKYRTIIYRCQGRFHNFFHLLIDTPLAKHVILKVFTFRGSHSDPIGLNVIQRSLAAAHSPITSALTELVAENLAQQWVAYQVQFD